MAEFFWKRDTWPDFEESTVYTDEAMFKLNWMVNRRNYITYAFENPHSQVEVPIKSQGVHVWAGINANGGLIGPYFFDRNVTGLSYKAMLEEFAIPELMTKFQNWERLIWQQDGAPHHWALTVRSFLNEVFSQNWIIIKSSDHPVF